MSRTEWSSTFPGGKAATPRPLASLAAQFSRHFSGHHRNAFSQHISLPIYHIPLVFSPSLLPPEPFPPQHTGLPPTVEPAKFQTRIIVRDVTGKYCWDCAMLYGPQMFPCPGQLLSVSVYIAKEGERGGL